MIEHCSLLTFCFIYYEYKTFYDKCYYKYKWITFRNVITSVNELFLVLCYYKCACKLFLAKEIKKYLLKKSNIIKVQH